jgi:hypothetical protein
MAYKFKPSPGGQQRPGDASHHVGQCEAMLCHDPVLDQSDQRLQSLKLRRQQHEARPGTDGNALILIVCDDRQQLLDPFAPLSNPPREKPRAAKKVG